jgi:protein with PEP-CTERM/exosortase system signal
MRKSLVVVFVALVLAASSAVANAGTIVLDLTSDHCTGLCGPQASFGTVTLTEVDADTVTVDIVLFNGNKFVKTGFDGVVGFNLTGNQTLTVDNITTGFVLLQSGPYSQFDGFGTFEYVIDGTFKKGAGNAVPGPLSFTVSGTGLTAASFLEYSIAGGGDPAYFAVDIISGTNGNTGLVDASTSREITEVPDGGSALTLLGSALFAIGMLRRKVHRN